MKDDNVGSRKANPAISIMGIVDVLTSVNAYPFRLSISNQSGSLSLCSSQAAPQSLAIIKKDIDENGGLMTSQVKACMIVIQLLQWPIFLAAIYSLSQ